MPPRLSLRSLTSFTAPQPPSVSSSIPTFLLPFLSHARSASILSDLRNLPSSYGTRIRVGRGPSSRKGGKSGRGHKGQKQKGSVPKNFQGGQTPDHIVHGHFGFKNTVHGVEMSGVNLDTIQEWINQGRIDPKRPITLRELAKSNIGGNIKEGVKLLGRGRDALSTPIHVVVSRASKSAIAAVEALGGSVTTRFYTPAAIRRIKRQEMHPYVSLRWDQGAIAKPALMVDGADTEEGRVKSLGYEYRLPDPTGRKDLEYYRDKENRGYLSHLVKEGYSPSMWFKTPLEIENLKAAKAEERRLSGGKKRKGLDRIANALW